MLAVNIKFCITNLSTGITFKIPFLIKKVVFFIKKVEGSEIVGLKILRSNSKHDIYYLHSFKMSS